MIIIEKNCTKVLNRKAKILENKFFTYVINNKM